MSILLSAYFPEGIVFVADKNATITPRTRPSKRYVEPTLTKVFLWPRRRATVGFVGLAALAGYRMDEWLRVFIAGTRDFTEIDTLAHQLQERVQSDFQNEFSPKADLTDKQMVVHLGGFAIKNGISVPVMYHIRNTSWDPQTRIYSPGRRTFDISEDVERDLKGTSDAKDYPTLVRNKLQSSCRWYNNGFNLFAFNLFKDAIWQSLQILQDNGFAPERTGLDARAAFCMMAVEVFGAYFTHHFYPQDRAVGGGVDVAAIPWPA